MPKESRSRMQKWPSSTLCPPNSTVTGTTHFYPVAIRSAHVICAQALRYNQRESGDHLGRRFTPACKTCFPFARARAVDEGRRELGSAKVPGPAAGNRTGQG